MGPPGTLDNSFAAGGTLMTPPAGVGNAMVIQPDGKIVVAGQTAAATPDLLVVRFLSSGALDPDFAGGVATFGFGMPSEGTAVALQPDGKIVVAGSIFPGVNLGISVVARLRTDGTPDPEFGMGTGGVQLDLGHPFARVEAITVQPDGGIVVAGIVGVLGNDYDGVVARLKRDGTPDNSFGEGNGRVQVSFGPGLDNFHAVALQPDGKIFATGTTGNQSVDIALFARLTSGGGLDPAFAGGAGISSLDVGDSGNGRDYVFLESIALQPDGKIVIAGSATSGAGFDASIVRLNDDGTPDRGFSTNGVKVVSLSPPPDHNDRIIGLALQSDGKYVLGGSVPSTAGSSNFDAIVARFGNDGSFDLGFGAGGVTKRELSDNVNATDAVQAIALDADGRIVLAGSVVPPGAPSKLLLARFWP